MGIDISPHSTLLRQTPSIFAFERWIRVAIMAVGKNKRLSKGKKGLKKRTQDPFTRKDWYSIKAPSTFNQRDVGKTLVNRTTGLKSANDALKGRIFEVSLADLQNDEDHAYHGLDFTSDKLRSLVRKWQTLIEANVTVFHGRLPPAIVRH